MKKLSILLILFTLFSCSKKQDMSYTVKLFYNGVEYNDENSTIEKTLMIPSADPLPVEDSLDNGDLRIQYVIYQDLGTKYKFIYSSTDRHIFYINNTYISTFVGDIKNTSNNLIGRAYDNKGNYILFENL
ncbi:MAG: hypothetical protein ACK459_15155 [Akkermansiaceae bacterium]|jgi:hypothetical protein